jgi:DMSO/TMAO reductase YedYZ heme-binding membrane subunit
VIAVAASNNGQELWYLTRGSGAVALLLLTASVLLGVANTTRWKTDNWPRFVVYGLHRNLTLLALAFTGVHVVTTIADAFAPIGIVDVVVPFLSPYRPFWLGLGTLAFDLLLALIVTSLLRRRIGNRTWRLVHWLAYGAWPVALLHSLGTGSDARAGWMLFLGVSSGLVVVGAVMWRLLAAQEAEPIVRAAGVLGAVGIAVALVVWARSGPLQHGWAARAGTPESVLGRPAAGKAGTAAARRTTRTVRSVRHAVSGALPRGRFSGSLHGRITEAPTEGGLVVVTIDARSTGSFRGRVHIALRGFPVDGGGVQMNDSVVGVLPAGAPRWSSGTVTGLDGTRVVSTVRDPSGKPVLLQFDLRLGGGSAVGGSMRGESRS